MKLIKKFKILISIFLKQFDLLLHSSHLLQLLFDFCSSIKLEKL